MVTEDDDNPEHEAQTFHSLPHVVMAIIDWELDGEPRTYHKFIVSNDRKNLYTTHSLPDAGKWSQNDALRHAHYANEYEEVTHWVALPYDQVIDMLTPNINVHEQLLKGGEQA